MDVCAHAGQEVRRMVRLPPPRRHRGAAREGQSLQGPVPHPAHDDQVDRTRQQHFLELGISTRKPTRKMLYERCHEMIDLIMAKLS